METPKQKKRLPSLLGLGSLSGIKLQQSRLRVVVCLIVFVNIETCGSALNHLVECFLPKVANISKN